MKSDRHILGKDEGSAIKQRRNREDSKKSNGYKMSAGRKKRDCPAGVWRKKKDLCCKTVLSVTGARERFRTSSCRESREGEGSNSGEANVRGTVTASDGKGGMTPGQKFFGGGVGCNGLAGCRKGDPDEVRKKKQNGVTERGWWWKSN